MAIKFFHSFDYPQAQIEGIASLEHLKATADLVFRHGVQDKLVLDIGAWDGFYSFEAERRGARLVHATDHFCWSGPGWGTKAGFDHVHEAIGSHVISTDVDVFDLDPEYFGTFDLVLFLGVLYHLKDPFGGLRKAAAMTHDCLVVETHADMLDTPESVMRMYSRDELNGDPTNFFAPNVPALTEMLRRCGFRRFEHHIADPTARSGRLIMHAWRD